jgi:hypothetical protein
VKLIPQNNQLVGRLLITKLDSPIVSPDPTKGVTKVILVQRVGADAAAAGYKPGDLVIPRAIGSMFLRGGTHHVVYCEVKEILFKVDDVCAEDFVADDGKTAIRSLDPADVSNGGPGTVQLLDSVDQRAAAPS